MSFEIYPAPGGNADSVDEKEWLVEQVIIPELPTIRESLYQCHRLLRFNKEIKLAISSYQSEYIKGVMTRSNDRITRLDLQLKNIKSLNHGYNYRLKLVKPIELPQILKCDEFLLETLLRIDDILTCSVGEILVKLEQTLVSISKALNYLQTPIQSYLFPLFRTSSVKFEPSLPDNICIEFFINDNDLFLEFHELEHVTTRPWSIVSEDGRSFVDDLKLKISKQRNRPVNEIILEELNKVESNFFNFFHSNKILQDLKYVENCITYKDNENNPMVVMVKKNFEIPLGDAQLLQISTKLSIVELNLMKFYTNLLNVM